MTETQNNPDCNADPGSGPKFFDVVLYRSGFDDITIRLAAKDSAQACQKAIKAYGSWNIVRVRNAGPVFCNRCDIALDKNPEYPYVSDLGEHIIIGPECFSDKAEQNIMWKGQHYAATSDATDDEQLQKINHDVAQTLKLNLSSAHAETLINIVGAAIEQAYRVGFISGRRSIDEEGEDNESYEADQEVRRAEYAQGIEIPQCVDLGTERREKAGLTPTDPIPESAWAQPSIGMAEEPEEAKQARRQRKQDQADLIELILHYKNPADEETRMRQIRVVMD
jgi:hypothetical protein